MGYNDKFFEQLIQDQKIAEQKHQAWNAELDALLQAVVDETDKSKEAA